ncbi:MAG: hypothetical protein H6909_04025 [Rickettsiaceae bacterium]|nr:hypothetical protein [Rickettsiaceae bacterium]
MLNFLKQWFYSPVKLAKIDLETKQKKLADLHNILEKWLQNNIDFLMEKFSDSFIHLPQKLLHFYIVKKLEQTILYHQETNNNLEDKIQYLRSYIRNSPESKELQKLPDSFSIMQAVIESNNNWSQNITELFLDKFTNIKPEFLRYIIQQEVMLYGIKCICDLTQDDQTVLQNLENDIIECVEKFLPELKHYAQLAEDYYQAQQYYDKISDPRHEIVNNDANSSVISPQKQDEDEISTMGQTEIDKLQKVVEVGQ